MNKILKWYSTLFLTLGFVTSAFDLLNDLDFGTFFIYLVLSAPIVYYLWKVALT